MKLVLAIAASTLWSCGASSTRGRNPAGPAPETVPVVLTNNDQNPNLPSGQTDAEETAPSPYGEGVLDDVYPSGKRPKPDKPVVVETGTGELLHGKATWYGRRHHGGATASGEKFDMNAFTAAHLTLPMGTMVRVTHVKSGRSVVVRINDRGPYGKDRTRIIDVSEAAARELGIIDAGVAEITLQVISQPEGK